MRPSTKAPTSSPVLTGDRFMSSSVANAEGDWKPLATPESDPVAESCGADWVARLQPPPRSERDASDLGDAAIIIWNFCSRLQYTLGDHAPPAGSRKRGGQALGRRGVQGISPLQLWRTRGASECGVPTRLRRVARRRAGVHSRADPEANGAAIRVGDAS